MQTRPSIHILRLHCALIMQSKPEDMILLLGICCSTYVAVNRGTNKRCIFLPRGNPVAMSVYRANKLTGRLLGC